MKMIRRAACLTALAALAATAWPAQAAGPYTIKGGGGANFSSGPVLVANLRGPACADAIALHPAQGVDSQILDGRGFANRWVAIDWSAEQNMGGLDLTLFDATCAQIFIAGHQMATNTPGRWVLPFPGNVRYAVFSSRLATNVTFSVNPM